MKNYYIFLDIDGVLWDWKYIKSFIKKGGKVNGVVDVFNPESINALNYLIKYQQSHNKDVTLVISSTWRRNMPIVIEKLKHYGLDMTKVHIEKIPQNYGDEFRGKLIKNYLQEKNDYDFVIIDDEMFDYRKENLLSHLIKTNIANGCLNKQCIDKYLQKDLTK